MSTDTADEGMGDATDQKLGLATGSLSAPLWGLFGALTFMYINELWGLLRNMAVLGDIFPRTFVITQIGVDIGLVSQFLDVVTEPLVIVADLVPANWGVGMHRAIAFAPIAFVLAGAVAYVVLDSETEGLPTIGGITAGLAVAGALLVAGLQMVGVVVPSAASPGYQVAAFLAIAFTGVVANATRLSTVGENDRIDRALEILEGRRILRQLLALWALLGVVFLTRRLLLFLNFEVWTYVRLFAPWISEYATQFAQPNFEKFTTYSIENEKTGWSGLIDTIVYVLSNPTDGFPMLLESFASNQTLVGRSAVTVIIGFCGTVLGFPFALLFGVLGSERVTPFPFNFIFRGTMSTIRAIPALVWIYILIALTNISQAGAVLAIAIDTIGNMGRLFTDELEEIEEGPIEAMRSTGGSRSQVVSFGMLSQVTTAFIAWALYILEINVRIAISLGIVGAGGIGQYISGRFAVFDYGQGGAGLFMVIVIVISVELLSTRIRARLRPEEHDSKGILDILKGLGDGQKWFGWSPKN